MNSFIFGLIIFIIFVVTIISFFRFFKIQKTMHWIVLVFFLMLLFSIVLITVLKVKIDFMVFYSTYLFLFLLFTQIFSIFYKSISLRIIQDLMMRKSGSANFQWIHEELIVKESYRRRILELERMGIINIDGDNILLTNYGYKISQLLVAVQKKFSIIHSG